MNPVGQFTLFELIAGLPRISPQPCAFVVYFSVVREAIPFEVYPALQEFIPALIQALLQTGPEVVALKRGAEGCTIITKDQQLEAPAFTVEAVDPTGAGDCFDAGFVVGLLEGLPLEEVGRLANACGALGATQKGPMEGAFRRDAVEEFMTTGRAPR